MARRRTDPGRGLPALGLGLLLLAGCRHLGPHHPPVAPVTSAPHGAPWQVPPERLRHQSLFRLRVDGPEGEGTLRLLLRLVDPERYQLLVSDRLGRAVYALDAHAGEGLLIDHQNRRACPVGDTFELAGVPLDPIPLAALPALLLGRLPARPAAGSAALPEDGEASFTDTSGRLWSLTLAAGEPVAWSLLEGGQPALWWRRAGRGQLLSDRVRGVQLSWEETLHEPLVAELGVLQVPAGYATGECAAP